MLQRKLVVSVVAVFAALIVLSGEKLGAAAMMDFWGPLQHLRSTSGLPIAAIHLARLCDGRTLMMGGEARPPYGLSYTAIISPQSFGEMILAPTKPVTHQLTAMSVPLDLPFNPADPSATFDQLVCGGSMFDEDGNLIVGGHSRIYSPIILGTPYSLKLNASGTTWTRLPNEFVGKGEFDYNGRWYPTFTPVASPSLLKVLNLIVGGSVMLDIHKLIDPTKRYYPNDSIELDEGSGTNRLLVSHEGSHTDLRNSSGYPHVFRQMDGRQLIHGASGRPIFFDVASGVLTPTNSFRPGSAGVLNPSDGSCAAALPIYWGDTGPYPNGSFLAAGGRAGTQFERSLDVYNARTGVWTHFDMGVRRNWCVIKPLMDGRMLILGGVALDGTNGQGRVQIFDPATNTLVTGSSEMTTKRGYHTVAISQLDGSLFVCSGWPHAFTEDNIGTGELTAGEAKHCQAYYPDYVWKKKPTVAYVPPTIALGSTVDVVAYIGSNLRPIVDARLMGLPSDTHSYDSSHSNVQLRVVRSIPINGYPNYHLVTLQLPRGTSGDARDSAHFMPPGCYTLTVIDDQGVPSPMANTKVIW